MQVPYLERYEILQVLGQGGMGVVYLARQKKLDRLVAIKSISPYLAQEPEVRERFAAEASVLARLSHPNIVTLFDYIEEPDALYLVMEYVEGKALSEILKAGPLPLESIRKFMNQILEAFAYAHAKGVIHRDIKPSNILITPEGQVKILDFGVAKILSSDHSQTRTGMRLGTLMYMSPEQVKGEKNLDARSDIYSLGVVFFEMLMGKPPYDPEIGEFEMSLRIVKEPLFQVDQPPAHIPWKLLEIVLHATEKEPCNRYASCKEFQEALDKAFQEETPSAPTELVQALPPSKAQKRRKYWIGLGSGIGILLVGILVFFLFQGGRETRPESMVDTLRTPNSGVVLPSVDSLKSDTTATLSANATSGPEKTPSEDRPKTEKRAEAPVKRPPQKEVQGATALSAKPTSHSVASDSQPRSYVPLPPISPQEVLKAEVQNFKKHGILQVKADFILTNTSAYAWRNVRISLMFLNKEGKVKKKEMIEIPEIQPYGRWEKKLDYLVGGTASIEAQVISAEKAP